MDRETIINILKQSWPDLKSRYPLHHMALFGSVARNEGTEQSDVDILVDVDPKIGLGFVDLSEELERLVEGPVDIASARGLNPKLKKRIEKEMIHVG